MLVDRCPWYVAGPLLGILIVGLRAALNRPFGALGGYIDFAEHARTPSQLGVSSYLLAGFVVGGAAFALVTGNFGVSLAYDRVAGLSATTSAQAGLLVLAGAAIGFGARTAGGCTSGHGLCGTSLGSPASFVAAMSFFATAVIVARLVARWTGVL